MPTPLLNGEVDDRDLVLEGLRSKVATLQTQLGQKDDEINALNRQLQVVETGVRELRKTLTPWYRVLQKVFGELDAMNIPDESGAPAVSDNGQSYPGANSSKWEAIIQRYSGNRIGDVIRTLLLHGPMNQNQIAAALGTDPSNVSKHIVPSVKRLGLIVKDGSLWRLKEL